MVKIRMTSGALCWKDGAVIRAGDPPFEVDEALARRLVEEKGVAEYVTPYPVEEADETANPEEEAEEPAAVPLYHIGMTAKELREIGAEYGLTFKQGMSKADMVSKMDELFGAQEPVEDAPTFDAAEAVQ